MFGSRVIELRVDKLNRELNIPIERSLRILIDKGKVQLYILETGESITPWLTFNRMYEFLVGFEVGYSYMKGNLKKEDSNAAY